MAKRGRKSAAEKNSGTVLSAVGLIPNKPSAPKSLDATQRKRWDHIVGEHDANRWKRTDLSLLEQMIRTETYVEECEKLISKHGQIIVTRLDEIRENPAVATRDRHLKTIMSIQRALRLPPSTRTRADSASLKPNAKKTAPWQR